MAAVLIVLNVAGEVVKLAPERRESCPAIAQTALYAHSHERNEGDAKGGSCTLSGVEKVSIRKTIIHDFLGLDIADGGRRWAKLTNGRES